MADQVRAPWTPEQVEALNGYQKSGVFHPFTCGPCRDADPEFPMLDDHLLVATEAGWICPTCDNTQEWAWAWMADEAEWKRLDWRGRWADGR